MSEDFWGLSDGGDATEDVSTSYEVASGSFEAFPEGTKLLAMVTDAEWRTNDQTGLENLSLTWTVVKPEEVANRKVFQSLWLTDLQPEAKDPEKKRDKARRMFAAIDANAGGKLAKKPSKPDAEAILIALANKQMVIRLGEYEGKKRDGGTVMRNYVQAVGPKTEETYLPPPTNRAPSRQASRSGAPAGGIAFDDDIPFAPEWRV